eukprot:GHVL01033105.1.p1 GENE.GHVL01033105.1~~GHVL01033105.1.p1  ORF type:complete len:432 (+),score=77.30 GHVL01033105.1:18-1313(+)
MKNFETSHFPRFLLPSEKNLKFANLFTKANLPYTSFRPKNGGDCRLATVIGDKVLDLRCLATHGWLHPSLKNRYLNDFMSLGKDTWSNTRTLLQKMVSDTHNESLMNHPILLKEAIFPIDDVDFELAVNVGDYTDFYASKEHATNLGTMLRGPKNALTPNWLHMPIGYHGRASSLVVSGTPIRRPSGQTLLPDTTMPTFGPSKGLDFELEMGFFVGGGNEMGHPINIDDAKNHIFGMVLLNDWSARDIQKWEGQPLGPFQAKNFGTTLSPFIVTMDALEPFATRAPPQDPQPLPYLRHKPDEYQTYDINLEVYITTKTSSKEHRLCYSNLKYLYWSIAQMLTHHSVGGCPMKSGDLCGTGTISGPEKEMKGSMIELTWKHENLRQAIKVQEDADTRRVFLEDGDTINLRGWCENETSIPIGFGDCRGTIIP